MWVHVHVRAAGARHSKSLERRCPRTACLRPGPKIIYTCYTRCALIRDRQPTAWDGFARPAETEATCIRKVKPFSQSDGTANVAFWKLIGRPLRRLR